MEFQLTDQELAITYQITAIGEDYEIRVFGGDAHIGSVTVIFNHQITTLTAKNHKDYFLSQPLAEALKNFPHRTVILAGFHLDNITKGQIQRVLALHQLGIAKIKSLLYV